MQKFFLPQSIAIAIDCQSLNCQSGCYFGYRRHHSKSFSGCCRANECIELYAPLFKYSFHFQLFRGFCHASMFLQERLRPSFNTLVIGHVIITQYVAWAISWMQNFCWNWIESIKDGHIPNYLPSTAQRAVWESKHH